ncbi:MAG: hypothetical protein M1835_003568 [Candelina submexicana]|nr:MAG: hypothetical protein M1835_003568 [Candelina submexicana]
MPAAAMLFGIRQLQLDGPRPFMTDFIPPFFLWICDMLEEIVHHGDQASHSKPNSERSIATVNPRGV